MAVYGNLKDFPFADILAMISVGSGRFCIRNHPCGKNFEFHIRSGYLKALVIDERPATDVLMVRSWVATLITSVAGDFEFVREQVGEYGDYHLPLNQLMASGFANNVEWETMKEYCPHAETVFLLSPGPLECWMEPELESFLDQTRDLLEEGACGEHLAVATGYPIEDVQLKLYKLNATQVIYPARSFRRDRRLVDVPGAAPNPPTYVMSKKKTADLRELVDLPPAIPAPVSAPPARVNLSAHFPPPPGLAPRPEPHTTSVLGRFLDGLRKRLTH